MNLDIISRILIRCFFISFGFLALWTVAIAYVLPQWVPWVYDIHAGLFGVGREQIEYLNYALIGLFKILTFMFFLIPWLAIRWAKR